MGTIVAAIVAPIVDQTCIFQCLIPMAIYQSMIGEVMHHLVGMGLKEIESWYEVCSVWVVIVPSLVTWLPMWGCWVGVGVKEI